MVVCGGDMLNAAVGSAMHRGLFAARGPHVSLCRRPAVMATPKRHRASRFL